MKKQILLSTACILATIIIINIILPIMIGKLNLPNKSIEALNEWHQYWDYNNVNIR